MAEFEGKVGYTGVATLPGDGAGYLPEAIRFHLLTINKLD